MLLVDDELRLVETLKEILDVNGYETTLAMDGIQALEKSREFMPDIILCDIMMPKMEIGRAHV